MIAATDQVLFIIVLFKRSWAESAACISLKSEISSRGETAALLVYDNSPSPQVLPDTIPLQIHYQHNAENGGVSIAYNYGHDLAHRLDKQWLFFLDQDTTFSVGTLAHYFSVAEKNPGKRIFAPVLRDEKGIVSPFLYRRGGGVRLNSIPNKISLKQYRACNTGLLIQRTIFNEAGGYETSMPLDYSDIAFLAKVARLDDELVVVPVELSHQFSGSTRMTPQAARERFVLFCAGAKAMGKFSDSATVYHVRRFLRAFRLMWEYGDVQFLKIYFAS